MSLLKMDGFDEYTVYPYKWTYSGGGPAFYSYDAPGVFGYGRYLNNISGPYFRGAASMELVVGCHFRGNGIVDGTWNADSSLSYFNFYDAIAGKGMNSIGVTIDGRLQLNKWSDTFGAATVILAQSTLTINPKVWYWFSFKYIVGNPGVFVVYVNDIEYINYVGNTRGQTENAAFTDFYFAKGLLGGSAHYDNMFIMDTAGVGPFNDILPETRIYTLLPNAAGDLTQWNPNGDPSNFENVNNLLTTDPPAAYNDSSNAGDKDCFQFDTVSFSGIPQVDMVQIHLAGAKSDAGARVVRPFIRTGGVNFFGDNFSLAASWSGSETNYALDPVTGLAWDLSDVGGAAYQFGYELVS